MPVEKTANFIRIRVASPKLFTRFRVKILGKGIKAVIGFKKGGGSQIQSLLFPRGSYTLAQAKAWVKKKGYSISETYAVMDIDVSKEGLDMFIERKIEIEESEKEEPKKDSEYWLKYALTSIGD